MQDAHQGTLHVEGIPLHGVAGILQPFDLLFLNDGEVNRKVSAGKTRLLCE